MYILKKAIIASKKMESPSKVDYEARIEETIACLMEIDGTPATPDVLFTAMESGAVDSIEPSAFTKDGRAAGCLLTLLDGMEITLDFI